MSDALEATQKEIALAKFFHGNRALYDAFRAGCLTQFPLDARMVEQGLRAGDAGLVRRVAHNIKSALTMLGQDALATVALQLELAAQHNLLAEAATAWPVLAEGLDSLS